MDMVSKSSMEHWGAAAAAGMALVVGTALAFEHIGGFIPCALCLEQRQPYYIGILVALAALVHLELTGRENVFRPVFFMLTLVMLYSAWLGGFHAGVEWGFWPGPADCAAVLGAPEVSANDLLAAIDSTRPPSCDEAAGRFLGLSFAGWNVLASLGLAALCLRAATLRRA